MANSISNKRVSDLPFEVTSRYIDPTTDFGFKKLFGEETSKDIIMSFIHDVLGMERPLSDINFLNVEQLGETIDDRAGIYDIFCKSEDGSHFIVEMQKRRQEFMKDRMIYYSTFPIVAQARKGKIDVIENGERKEILWSYKLSPIYCIAILDFTLRGNGVCVKRNSLRNDEPPHEIFYNKLRYITIELPLFDEKKPEYSLDKHLNKWLYFLKKLDNFEDIPEIFKDEIVFKKAFEIAEVANFTRQERRRYDESLKRTRDSYAVVEYAKKEGKLEIAQSMLKEKMDMTLIIKLTGLSEEEIAVLHGFEG